MSFFQVVIPPLDRPYTYRVPPELAGQGRIGQRVLVPLRHKSVTGFLWEASAEADPLPDIKPIERILDPQPFFAESLRSLLLWTARYYHYPLGRVLKTALPPGLSFTKKECWQITPLGLETLEPESASPEQSELLRFLTSGRGWTASPIPLPEEALAELEARGLICRRTQIKKETTRPQKVRVLYPGPEFNPAVLAEKDRALVRLLEKGPLRLSELRRSFPLSAGRLATFCRKGILALREETLLRNPLGETLTGEAVPHRLTAEQNQALHQIKQGLEGQRYQTVLLHGITGSGKTEIYLRAAEETLKAERQVLILVPEIGLVPQMEGRVRSRFGDRIAVLHSGLSPGERLDQWRLIQAGEAPIVLGTRSAVFAPLENPGLLVVDEEHDPSLKQQESLRYQARDLALVRGRLAGALVVMGSATPSLTTLHLRTRKKISIVSLTRRIRQSSLPEISLVDLKPYSRRRSESLLSPVLVEEIRSHLRAGGQVLLFLNRRGFEPLTLCTLCGAPVRCPNCSVSLSYHASSRNITCHLCGFHQSLTTSCPACGKEGVKTIGWGTEKVEIRLREIFPEVEIARLDRDAVSRKHAHYQILKRFQEQKTQILVGTQMITKGHDFPGVSLIGVLCADLSLNWPDFRSGERTVQLLMQVAGRAGRGAHPGKVIIQAYNPEHPVFDFVRRHDYLGFYREEIEFRRTFNYPPFSRLILLIFQGNSLHRLKRSVLEMGGLLERESRREGWTSDLEILGPVPAPMSKIKGRHRWHLLLKGREPAVLHRAASRVEEISRELLKGSGVQLILDVDPVDML